MSPAGPLVRANRRPALLPAWRRRGGTGVLNETPIRALARRRSRGREHPPRAGGLGSARGGGRGAVARLSARATQGRPARLGRRFLAELRWADRLLPPDGRARRVRREGLGVDQRPG